METMSMSSTYEEKAKAENRDALKDGLRLLGVLDSRGIPAKVGHTTENVEVPSRAQLLPPEAAEHYTQGYREENKRKEGFEG